MFEAFLTALDIADSQFYVKHNIYEIVFEKVVVTEEPYGLAIAGPQKIDIKKHASYPLFSIWKTNTHDNAVFVPPDKAYVLLTHLETKRLYVLPLYENPGKMPLPEEPDAGRNTPAKKRLSYSYESNWCDISLRRLNATEGSYRIQVLCGKMISNTIEFSVLGKQEGQLVDLRKKELLAEAVSVTKEHEELLVKSKHSPAIPERENIVISTTDQKVKPDQKDFFVNGSFNIATVPDFKDIPLEISIIIQDDAEGGVIEDKSIVPCKFLETGNGFVTGYFSFDLMRYYYNKSTDTFIIPKEICIIAVCGPVISNVLEVVNEKK